MEEDESAEDRDCDHELVGPYRLFSCEELDWVCREAIETTSEKLFTPINLSPNLINFDALPLDVNVKTLLSPGQMYLSDTNCNLELLPGVSHLLTFKPHCWFYTDADGHIHSAERSDEEMLTEHKEMLLLLFKIAKRCRELMLAKELRYQDVKIEILAERLEKKDIEASRLNKILKSEQCELEKVKIELQEKTDQLTDASIENAQLQEQLGKLKHAETLHGNDLNFIKLLKSKAEEKLAEQLQFNALLKKELDQLRMTQSTSAVSLENERLKTKITELQNKSSVLVAKCDDILNQMKLKTVEVEKLLEEKLQWHHEMNAKDQLLKETQIKLDELMGQTREMDQWQSQIRQLEAERPILMAQIGGLHNQMRTLNERFLRTDENLKIVVTEKKEERRQKEIMQGELARLMAESSAEIVKFRDQKASWFEEKKKLEEELVRKNRDIRNLNRKIGEIKVDLDEQICKSDKSSKAIEEIEAVMKQTHQRSQDFITKVEPLLSTCTSGLMAISSDIGDVVLKLQNCREALSSCLAPLSSSGLREPTGSFPKNCDRTILPFRSVTPKKRVENLRQLELLAESIKVTEHQYKEICKTVKKLIEDLQLIKPKAALLELESCNSSHAKKPKHTEVLKSTHACKRRKSQRLSSARKAYVLKPK